MTLNKDLRSLSSCSFSQTTHSATSMVYTLWSHKIHPDCSLLTALNMSFWAPLFQRGNFCGSLQQAFHVSPCASHAVNLLMLTRAQKQIMPLLSGCFFSIFLVTKATVLPMIYSSSQSPALASRSFFSHTSTIFSPIFWDTKQLNVDPNPNSLVVMCPQLVSFEPVSKILSTPSGEIMRHSSN